MKNLTVRESMITGRKRDKYPHKSGVLYQINVFSSGGDILIGKGWIVYLDKGPMVPVLINNIGEELEPGWCKIQATEDEPRLVVVNKTLQ